MRINLPSITDQDVADIRFAAEHDIDFLAVSFVRSAEAVRDARRIIAEAGGHPMRIIAKIENQEGIDNLDEIIDAADGIMVARGDLGVEVEFEMLPAAQRDMVRRCAIAGRPVIVATHLLESMIDNPMPTRAEVTDVANAVYEQVDAVMLSGETATGKYPVRCVSGAPCPRTPESAQSTGERRTRGGRRERRHQLRPLERHPGANDRVSRRERRSKPAAPCDDPAYFILE